MDCRALIVFTGLTTACQLNAGAAGSGGPSDTLGATSNASTTEPGSTDDGPPPPSTTTDATDTTDGGSTGPGGSTDDGPSDTESTGGATTTGPGESTDDRGEESSGDPPACEEDDTDIAYAYDGMLVPPMQEFTSGILGFDVAFSDEAEAGTLTVSLHNDCAGPLYLWGLAWDFRPGPAPENADSYYVSIDGEPEVVWDYGCDTGAAPDAGWHWIPIQSSGGACMQMPVVVDLAPGDHTIVVRNREEGSDISGDAAAIGAIAWSHDPAMDPTLFVDPG